MNPVYIKTYKTGELTKKIEALYEILKNCNLCPRKCGVNRLKGQKGYCKSTEEILVSNVGPHFGEEDVLVGMGGSGTIFFTNCNLGCVFCQNYEISRLGEGKIYSVEELAKAMLYLQKIGTHNINLVTPTHFVPQIVKSIKIAYENGLMLPIVFNCGGYESLETIRILDGVIDIYMPDFKYADNLSAKKYSNAPDYFERASEAIKEMHRQVGDLKTRDGVAFQGLLVRHLVMPNDVANSQEVLKFISSEISKETYINIMDQYRPCFKSHDFKEINRKILLSEYNRVIDFAVELGLKRGFNKRYLLI